MKNPFYKNPFYKRYIISLRLFLTIAAVGMFSFCLFNTKPPALFAISCLAYWIFGACYLWKIYNKFLDYERNNSFLKNISKEEYEQLVREEKLKRILNEK